MSTENVQNIANAMADIERRLRQSIKDARGTRLDFRAIAADPTAGVPPLLATMHYTKLMAILSSAQSEIIGLHHQMTEDAKARGIDVPPLPAEADDGEIVATGGGDR